jgi:hypothetical protein
MINEIGISYESQTAPQKFHRNLVNKNGRTCTKTRDFSDGKSPDGELEHEVTSMYQKIAAEGITNPAFLLVAPPLTGVLKRLLIVSSEEEAMLITV